MLRKLKEIYLSFRIDSARADLELSQLAMRDKVRMVHMHANKLETLLEQAGHTKRTHFLKVVAGLAHYEATQHLRNAARHNDLIVTPTPTEKKDPP